MPAVRRCLAVALAVLALGSAAMPAPTTAATVHTAGTGQPVVLVGVVGLRWEDVDETATPNLWRLADASALASMSIRTTTKWTCPVAGWLTISAGERAVDGLAPSRLARCNQPPRPRRSGAGAEVPGIADLRSRNASGRYSADIGLLGDTVTSAGGCITAVGRGATLAAADSGGRLTSYLPATARLQAGTFERCNLTIVDAGSLAPPTLIRPEDDGPDLRRLVAVDRRIGKVVAAAPPQATVIVIGMADRSTTPHLTVATARGPAPDGSTYDERWLTARSTRRAALVQLTDVLPTVLGLLGLDQPRAAIGSQIKPDGPRPPLPDAIDELVDTDTKAQVASRFTPHFFTVLVVSQLLLYGAAAVAVRRRWGGSARRVRVMQAMQRAALVFAAVPVSTYLANLVPWWRADHPLAALALSLLVALLAVTAIALLGPWRRQLLGPFGAVAAITGLVLLVDVMIGSPLQLSSLMGYSPLVAGRFYGFGNLAFALFATGMLLAATAVADALLRDGRQREAVAVVAITGVVAVLVDGWPRWGSDFGGVLALVPGFAVLALLVAGLRVSWWRAALIGLAAAATITVVAYLDWRHPAADRSHLGRFVQQVIDGDAMGIVQRKLEANLRAFRNYLLALIVPIGFAFVVLVLMRPVSSHAAALGRAYDRSATLRSGVIAVLVTVGIGFAVNDSGIAIPAVALFVAIPLILAASVRALELDEAEDAAPPPEPAR
ncbi:MAG: hypothetical protein ABJA93_06200 [Sporichthyaceae bacterium]